MDNFKDIYEFWDASPEQINRALISEQCHKNKKIKDINQLQYKKLKILELEKLLMTAFTEQQINDN